MRSNSSDFDIVLFEDLDLPYIFAGCISQYIGSQHIWNALHETWVHILKGHISAVSWVICNI